MARSSGPEVADYASEYNYEHFGLQQRPMDVLPGVQIGNEINRHGEVAEQQHKPDPHAAWRFRVASLLLGARVGQQAYCVANGALAGFGQPRQHGEDDPQQH